MYTAVIIYRTIIKLEYITIKKLLKNIIPNLNIF